jgi:hypothetical protein
MPLAQLWKSSACTPSMLIRITCLIFPDPNLLVSAEILGANEVSMTPAATHTNTTLFAFIETSVGKIVRDDSATSILGEISANPFRGELSREQHGQA